jgi:IS5 family transposase
MMRMLIVGYCMGLRSERRLCEEVHLNLSYRWFCCLGLDGKVPDHSTFSRNRHGCFRQSDILRHLFECVVEWCLAEGLVGGDGFAVDASLMAADANKQRSIPGDAWRAQDHGTEASGKRLVQYRRNFTHRRSGVTKDGIRFYRAKQSDCQSCDLKARCCPNTLRRRIPRSQDHAGLRALPSPSQEDRDAVRPPQTHLEASSSETAWAEWS